MSLKAPEFPGTKILKLEFDRDVYSMLDFCKATVDSVCLVFESWHCKRSAKVLEWYFVSFPFNFLHSELCFWSCCSLSQLCKAQFCSLVPCRSLGEAVWWRPLEAGPEASSHCLQETQTLRLFGVFCLLSPFSLSAGRCYWALFCWRFEYWPWRVALK